MSALGSILTSAGLYAAYAANQIEPIGIVIHHSTLPISVDGIVTYSPDAKTLDLFHKHRGFGVLYHFRNYHIGYHYVILPNGSVQPGRPEQCIGAHTYHYNRYLGICLIGDFSAEDNPDGRFGPILPSNLQMTSLLRLCAELAARYGLKPAMIYGHHELARRTECPGNRIDLDRVRTDVNEMLMQRDGRQKWRASTVEP